MNPFTAKRAVSIITPLPPGTFVVDRMDGEEALGQPFCYELVLVSALWDLDLASLLGQPMTVECETAAGTTRYFNGVVTQAVNLDGDGEYARYAVTLRPWLWLLSLPSDCRIFQDMSVPEIVQDVFGRAAFSDFKDELSGTYPKLEYCVQYRETDFNFVSRLLEHEGIYYFFRHGEQRHTLVLADALNAHAPQPGYELVEYRPASEPIGDREHLSSWVVTRQLRPGGFAATDYDFERPRSPLLTAHSSPQNHLHAAYERFDYPGGFLTNQLGETRVRRRLEERQADHQLVQASGDVRGLGAGTLFRLVDFPRADQNKEYLVARAHYAVRGCDVRSAADATADNAFRVELSLLDSRVPFRPAREARKPRVDGPQTAVVCAEDGGEISTDPYGRVMVKFHWDRYAEPGEPASCWVRVAQMWAGARWGGIQIPRAGQEVIVEFLEGDPDRPIITGAVYNGSNMPPYALPDNQTQTGIKTRSTPGGGPSNFNEIRFEDKLGCEEVYIQAEKDETINVKHDQSITVGGDRTLAVTGNDSVTVGGNETITVSGNETVNVTGARSTTVTGPETETFIAARVTTVTGSDTETILGKKTATYAAGRDETVESGDTLTVNGSNKTATVHGQYNITADAQFDVQQGASSILLKDQVKLNTGGPIQLINNSCSLDLKDGVATLWAADQITLQCGGAKISLMSDGTISIAGSNKVTATAEGSSTALNLEKGGASLTGDVVKVN